MQLIHAISGYCNNGNSVKWTTYSDEDVIGCGAVIVFLMNAKIRSAQDLKNMSIGDQRKTLVVFNASNSNVPIWRLDAMSNAQLVQMGMLWFTKIDLTRDGLLNMFGVQTSGLSDADAWNKVRQLLSQYSNENESSFQHTRFAHLLGKLALIAFLLRWNHTQSQLQQLSTAEQRSVLVLENYYRTGIPYALLNYQITDPEYKNSDGDLVGPTLYKRCTPFSEMELVNMAQAWYVIDKPHVCYNEICSVLTHDSFTGDKQEGSFTKDASRDQNRNIEEQLVSGVRAVRISADGGGELDHGGATDYGSLKGYLGRIATFLQNNPNEILTIIDETGPYTDSFWKDAYTSQLGKYLFYPNGTGNGLKFPISWPTYSEIAAGQWPSLKDMVENGFRVVVLHTSDYDQDNYPWSLHAYDGTGSNFLISTDIEDYGIDEDYNYRPACLSVQNSNKQRYNTQTPNLYLLNHYFYTHLLEHNTSSRAFSRYWGNTELIIEYAMLAWQNTGRKPNFLNIDFYDLPDIANNFLFDLANGLNWPDAYTPFEVPEQINARKPIMIVKSSSQIDPVQLGRLYNISCAAPLLEEDNTYVMSLARESDTDGAKVMLVKSDSTDAKQQWRVLYNTPQTGFAIVTPDGNFALYDPNWNDPDVTPGSNNNLILRSILGNQAGCGIGIQAASGDFAYLYKSNMVVGGNPHKIDTNNFNQPLSLWQVLGGGDTIDEDNLTVGRGAIDIKYDSDHFNQAWKFNLIGTDGPTSDGWQYYTDTVYNNQAAGSFTIPDQDDTDHQEGWGLWDAPSIDQLKAIVDAIPQLTGFSKSNNTATFNTSGAWLDPDLGTNTYVLDGYKET